jgi:hypothetical protein
LVKQFSLVLLSIVSVIATFVDWFFVTEDFSNPFLFVFPLHSTAKSDVKFHFSFIGHKPQSHLLLQQFFPGLIHDD